MSCLALYMLGPPEIECDGVPVKPHRRKAVALLVYLAVTGQGPGGRSHSRDSLAALLWPELDQSRARAGLRRALASLKKALGEGWADGKHPLEVDRDSVGLNPAADVWLDVTEFREKLAECRTHGHLPDQLCPACLVLLTEAAAMYRDDFLAGFTLRDSPAFDEWQFFQTEGLRADLARALERLVLGHGEQGQFEPAIAHARRWVALDPLHEPAHRWLMQLYARSDQRAAALRQYSECARVLQEEMGVRPSEETTQLYKAILEGRALPSQLDLAAAPVPSWPASGAIMSTGQRIADRFEIRDPEKDLLGRGSMGDVYRATDTHTGELVAIKALDPRVVARDPGILERFVREGEALRQLNHPNIVHMVAAVEEGGQHYLVTEYVAGGSLQDLMESQRPVRSLPIARVLEIALDLADALTRSHHLGIIHRDLKPANVLLAEDGTPRLTDFGIARLSEGPRLTKTGVLVGTPDFLSPEACSGQALDERTDIWAFGVLLFEMLTGETPFQGDSLTAKLTAILTQPVPDLAQRCPDAPEALVDLVYRMLEKDPGQRIPSVRLVGAELEAILKGREIPTPLRLAPGESRFAKPTPPAKAPEQPQVAHNLPAQLTSFVGRQRETAEVVQLLGATRLLTLTGPPGTGKTRLGLRVAAEVFDRFQDGVFFVDLAPIRDPGLVATTVAQVLGIRESGGQPLLDTLQNALRHKQMLLLLDNFEQIIGAAPLVGELLSSSPGLKALVTSREALRVYGEQEYPVPPLTLPDLDRAEPLPSLSQYEAVELFARRARAVWPNFALTEDNAPAVADICVRLDGLPLAIELAAARSRVLPPEMMRRRLENRLGVLVAGPRDLPARQRTLRGTIDWSYDLLDPPEQTLFARLAIFQGGRTVEAVDAICSHGLARDVLDGLESLLNKNLLRQEVGPDGEQRFVMLEMIHEYARERLEASGEAGDLHRRHAEYFLALAERAAPELRGARQQDWFVQLRAEQDNLRAALAWSLGEGEAELGLRLVGALCDFWVIDGHSAEGLQWTERTLASGQDAPPAARAGALNAAGSSCYSEGEYRKGQTYSGEALAIYRELGDEVGSAWALVNLSYNALAFPDECKDGIALCQEGLALFREAGHNPGIRSALNALGELGRLDGDYDLAQKAYEEYLSLSRERGYKLGEAIALANLGTVAMYRGLPEQARASYAESLVLLRELGDKKHSAMHLAAIAGPVAALGYPQAAARLLGASEAVLGALDILMPASDWSTLDRSIETARQQLDEATFDAAWAEGRAMSLEQAVSYALEVGQLAPTAPPPAPVREPEVAAELPSFLEGEKPEERPVFVVRERELAQLDGHLDRALSGQGRVVFVTGEAGQGKTALVAEFAHRAQAAHPDLVVAGGNCNAHIGVGDPYLPFREILGLLTGDVQDRWAAGAISQEGARRLWQALPLAVRALVEVGPDLMDLFVPGRALVRRAATVAPWPERADWLPRLEELVQRKAAVPADPNLQQSALFEQYARVVGAVASQRPLLLVLDDLQWVDGGSTNLLFHLGRHIQGSRALIVGAYRPAEVALGRLTSPLGGMEGGRERHPLEPVVNEFRRQFGDIEVDLGQAEDRQFIEAFLDSEPNRLGEAFRETLYRQTRGHPLSTIELLRNMQERGDLVRDGEGRWVEGRALDWEALPARVEAVIAERIGRLVGPARELLRVASVEGETFTAEVAARVLGADGREVVRRLGKLERDHRLVSAQGIRRLDPAVNGAKGAQRLSFYRFRHILFQRYLYNSLGEGERVYLHEDVGTALEALYGEAMEEISVQLARHFQEAGVPEKAVAYLRQAGERAMRMSAHQESIAHFTQGLELLKTLPDTPKRDQQQLDFLVALGVALVLTKGHAAPEVEMAYAQARELSRQVGETPQLFQVLHGLRRYYWGRGDLQTAHELGEELLTLARSAKDPDRLSRAHAMHGECLYYLGEFALSRAHLEEGLALCDPQQRRSHLLLYGNDTWSMSRVVQGMALWHLGYPDHALKRGRKGLTLAQELSHPFTLAATLYFTAVIHQLRREVQTVRDQVEALLGISAERRFALFLAWGTALHGWALAEQGEVEEGIAQMEESLDAWRTMGGEVWLSIPLSCLANAYGKVGKAEEGLALVTEGLGLVDKNGERCWEAELYRLKGELLLKSGQEAEAEEGFRHALRVAAQQAAKSWELRAAMSLSHLLKRQGREQEARNLLREIYGWFTEGFDTTDLKEAKALLEELS